MNETVNTTIQVFDFQYNNPVSTYIPTPEAMNWCIENLEYGIKYYMYNHTKLLFAACIICILSTMVYPFIERIENERTKNFIQNLYSLSLVTVFLLIIGFLYLNVQRIK